MSKYTPTVEEVRAGYIGEGEHWLDEKIGEEFDRWLAAHDAEVAAKALEDAAAHFESGSGEHDEIKYSSSAPLGWSDRSVVDAVMASGPVMDWLRARAAAIRTTNNESEGKA